MAPKHLRKGSEGILPNTSPAKQSKKELLRKCERWIMDPDKLSRINAVRALASIKGPDKKEILIKALSYNGTTIMDVIFQLKEIKEDLDQEDYLKVADSLRIPDANVRMGAVHVLSMSDNQTIYDILEHQLYDDRDAEVMYEIVHALWEIELRKRTNRSFSDLVVLLGNPEQAIRYAVLERIKENGHLLTENDLVLIGANLENEERDIRISAVKALDCINRPDLTHHLLTWYILEERDEEVQKSMLEALRHMRSIKDVDQQLHCLHDNPYFSSNKKLIEEILDDTLPGIPPDAIRLRVKIRDSILDDEFYPLELKELNKLKA